MNELEIKNTIKEFENMGVKSDKFLLIKDIEGNDWIAPASPLDKIAINLGNFIPTNESGRKLLIRAWNAARI